MVFLSICTALYDYIPQGDGELAIHEGELVYILEKSIEDDWWKGKKKAPGEEDEEPVGLIPNNYVEEAEPTHHAKALYDYSRQTDEELSFSEDAALEVYDSSDPDWTLVGLNGEYGFAPSNYIEIADKTAERPPPKARLSSRSPERDSEQDLPPTPTSPSSPQPPAAALAGIIHKQVTGVSSITQRSLMSTPSLPPRNLQYTPDASDEEPLPPSLPQRPELQQIAPSAVHEEPPRSPDTPGVVASPPYNRARSQEDGDHNVQGGFHLYNISEIVSAMGKQKKMPTTLGINLTTGVVLISPEKSRDGPQQEWTAEKLTHYSIEGKHVFIELVRPSKSLDLHAGAKDTAQEIVAALGELAGASKAEGLREVIAAGSSVKSQRKGHMLYDFVAQGDDEVTVGVGDEVIILDDSTEEWWQVRRLKNGKEGVVPGSYVEATGFVSPTLLSSSGLNAGRSTVEQNRLEEERQTREAMRNSKQSGGAESNGSEVGPGMKLPTRGSSLTGGQDSSNKSSQQNKRDSPSGAKSSTASSSKSKPDSAKTRTWTDRSGSFKVEAEFIGLKDGKIHLHKLNGVKIAVPVVKMAMEDLEYVEQVTGVSLDEDKPLSDIKRRNQKEAKNKERSKERSKAKSLPLSESNTAALRPVQLSKPPDYDWFDFFLKCGVSPYQCERYSSNFNRDSMDESVLPDITPPVMRTLGMKEGDILKVMKYLDNKYGRMSAKSKLRNVSFGGEEYFGIEEGDGSVTSPGGGLFSGPGGALKNNTRKGRPAPAVQTNDTVDPEAFKQLSDITGPRTDTKDNTSNRLALVSTSTSKDSGGFDDDAWDVKPSKLPTAVSPPIAAAPTPAGPAPTPASVASALPPQLLTGSMADLSLLSQPLQPVIAHSPRLAPPAQNQNQNIAQSHQQTILQSQPQSGPQQPQFQYQPQQQLTQNLPQQQNHQQPTGASPTFFSSVRSQVNGTQQQQNYGAQLPPGQNFTSQPTGMGQLQTLTSQAPPLQTINFQSTGLSQPGFQLNVAPRQRPQAPQFSQQGGLMPPPPPRPLSAPQNITQQNNFGPPPLQPQLTGIPNQAGLQHQVTSPGQTLNDPDKMRLQQQFNQQQQQLQPQFTAFGQQNQSLNQFPGGFTQQPSFYGQQQQQPQLQLQMTGVQPSPLYLNGQHTGSPFADPRSPPPGSFQPHSASLTGFASSIYNPLTPQQTASANTIVPPALQPQQTGINGMSRPTFDQSQPQPSMSLMPPMPQQQVLAPLQPQKTGPAPPVRFGVANEMKKLMPQAPSKRANLSYATPQNPFGF